MAHLIKETFETVAKGIYTIEEVRLLMEKKGLAQKSGKPLCKPYFYRLLKNKVYAGYIEKFGECHKGLFEPIISEQTFNQIQKVLKNRGRTVSQYRKDSPDFPLRRFIKNENNQKLTGSWSKGRAGKKYAFYRFGGKGSNFNRDGLEKAFMAHMDGFSFKEEHIDKLEKFLKLKLEKATLNKRKEIEKIKNRAKELREKQTVLIDKNIQGLLKDHVLQEQLEFIDKELSNIEITLIDSEESEISISELIEYAKGYLRSPSIYWREASIEKQLKLQRFQFPSGLVFNGQFFGTAEINCVFKAKDHFLNGQLPGVDLRRFELLTFALQKRCSTN